MMELRTASHWTSAHTKVREHAVRERLHAAAAVLDALCVSTLLWLTILSTVR